MAHGFQTIEGAASRNYCGGLAFESFLYLCPLVFEVEGGTEGQHTGHRKRNSLSSKIFNFSERDKRSI